jgi:eukaryotic-like serine/threonine-protein kinase
MMGRSKNHDVFVIGDELLDTETTALGLTDRLASTDDQEPGGAPPGLDRPTPPGRRDSRSMRWLAALSLGAIGATAIALLEFFSGTASQPQRAKASAHSPLVLRPATSDAVSSAPTIPRPSPGRERMSSHDEPTAARRPSRTGGGEPERESNDEQAPVSSPAPSVIEPVAPPSSAPPASLPPSSPPPSGGGDSGGQEQFGFER